MFQRKKCVFGFFETFIMASYSRNALDQNTHRMVSLLDSLEDYKLPCMKYELPFWILGPLSDQCVHVS